MNRIDPGAPAVAICRDDCRERLAWILAHCPIGEDGKREIENALKECAAHPEISGLSTHAIQPLIQERDPEIKEKAISSISKALESGKDPLISGVKMNRNSPFFMAGKTGKTPGPYVPTLPTLFFRGSKNSRNSFLGWPEIQLF